MSYPEFYGRVAAIVELRQQDLMRDDATAMKRISEIVEEFKEAQRKEVEELNEQA
jgi:hypothetical protein